MKRLRNDIILILIIIVVALVSAFLYFSLQTEGTCVSVIKNGNQVAVYSLKENLNVPISDEKNTNILVIENGKAYVAQATCPDKICVNHRPVSKVGETIVCLPAKLVLEINK